MKKSTLTAFGIAAALFASQALAQTAPNDGDHDGHGGHRGHMLEEADTNHDGAISKDEFLAHATQRFAKLDTNGDGKITKDEFEAAREKWKAKREEFRSQHGDMKPGAGDK